MGYAERKEVIINKQELIFAENMISEEHKIFMPRV
jgi:hypothetical protein